MLKKLNERLSKLKQFIPRLESCLKHYVECRELENRKELVFAPPIGV